MPATPAAQAERALLGAVMRKPEIMDKLSRTVRANDFADRAHREIYSACGTLFEKGIDINIVTLDEALTAKGKLDEIGGGGYLAELSSEVPAASVWESYAEIVLDASMHRRLATIAARLTEVAADPTSDIESIVAKAVQSISAVKRERSDWQSNTDVVIAAFESIEKRQKNNVKPCLTGIPKLDEKIGGFFGGELTIIGARPSVGKTAFGLFIAKQSAKSGHKVCFVSGEMDNVQIGIRQLADASGISGSRLRKATDIDDDAWAKLAMGMTDIGSLPISYIFTREIEEIISQTRTASERGECSMLVVDYVQLLTARGKFESERLKISFISKELKHLAQTLKIPVILLAQVGRQEGKPSKPMLSELKGSGSLEEDADIVLLMHRADDSQDKSIPNTMLDYYAAILKRGDKCIVVGVDKNRQGETGMTMLGFDAQHMRYYQAEDAFL